MKCLPSTFRVELRGGFRPPPRFSQRLRRSLAYRTGSHFRILSHGGIIGGFVRSFQWRDWLRQDHQLVLSSASVLGALLRRVDGLWLWQSSGLENRRSEAHIPEMATIVQCNCGAEYRRTEEKFLVPHTGDAVCTVCGAALESWRESTHVPTYELIERPERKPE